MVLTFFVVWGCVGWAIVCVCAIKAGARRHAMESAPSASTNSVSDAIALCKRGRDKAEAMGHLSLTELKLS